MGEGHDITAWVVVGVPMAFLSAAFLIAVLSVVAERGSANRHAVRRAEQPFAHELPYWAFLESNGRAISVNVDGTYTTFLALRGIDTDCLDNDALNQLSLALHGVLQSLPAGSTLQFLHATDSQVGELVERYREQANGLSGIGRRLVEAKAALLLSARGLRRSRVLLGISLADRSGTDRTRALGLFRRFPNLAAIHENLVGRLGILGDQVARALDTAGVRSSALSLAELREYIQTILNPQRSAVVTASFPHSPPATTSRAEVSTLADALSAREILSFAGLYEHKDHLVVERRLVRVITLKQLPSFTEPALFEALLVSLPFHARVALAIEALDGEKTLADLKRRRDRAHLLATLKEKRNQEAEAQEEDVAELIDLNLRSTLRMVRLSLTVVISVSANDPDNENISARGREINGQAELERRTAEVIRLIHSLHGAQAMVDEHAQLDEFLATLPGNARHGRRFRTCTSENAAHLLFAWQSYAGSAHPTVLFENGRRNLVGLDPFDAELDNPNAFMAGSSGSGKSSTTNYLLLNLLAAGAGALVVDVGGSYRRILDIFGGQYFQVSADGAEHGLNPFFAHADLFLPDGRIDERRGAFILAVVERMVSEGARPELKNTERAVLAQAIRTTYARVTTRTPILSDLVETLRGLLCEDAEDVAIARSLARDLRVWVEGPAARLLNRPSTVELHTSLAAFDLKGLETQPHLQSVVMVILSGIVWNLVMRDPTAKKVVVFDEVWRLLESPASARLIAELYRTSRKYSCSILTISQSVEDFTESSIASALTQNSATAYLLKHRRSHEVVAKAFRLNARELQVFQGLEMRRGEYTEALVLHGDHHFLARVVLSPLEYWIATTHPADLALEERVRKEHPARSRLELLEILAARWPRGAEA